MSGVQRCGEVGLIVCDMIHDIKEFGQQYQQHQDWHADRTLVRSGIGHMSVAQLCNALHEDGH